jgi:hypothetical protein
MHHADRTLQQTNLRRNLAGTRQSIRPQPSRQSVPLPCHSLTDALLRIGRNAAETNMGGLPASYSGMMLCYNVIPLRLALVPRKIQLTDP